LGDDVPELPTILTVVEDEDGRARASIETGLEDPSDEEAEAAIVEATLLRSNATP
jgi:hypothetical protein